jgi:bacteriorhodopsin
MPNLENFFTYAHWQYDVIGHVLTLTAAVFAAGIVYFLATSRESAPRYRLASIISAVVMVSASLEIIQLWLSWRQAFNFDPAAGIWRSVGTDQFSNGFRYVNWSLDVPMLLAQVLIVLGFANAEFWRRALKLGAAGLLMIWTGYVGQYYEPQAANVAPGSALPFYVWFAISSVFFLYILYALRDAIANPVGSMPAEAEAEFRRIWVLILVSWTLYPIAYLVPAFWADSLGMVARQSIYSVADITSKLIFGVMLGRAARFRSAHEGWEPAIAADPDAYVARERLAREGREAVRAVNPEALAVHDRAGAER